LREEEVDEGIKWIKARRREGRTEIRKIEVTAENELAYRTFMNDQQKWPGPFVDLS
jgi:hypothetical protein